MEKNLKLRTRTYLQEEDPYFYSKTAKQWQANERAVKNDATGETMWVNGNKEFKANYFILEETRPATLEELEEWKKSLKDKKLRESLTNKEKYRLRKAREEKVKKKQKAEQEAELWVSGIIDDSKTIFIAMKTNGLVANHHEILQLSIIDGKGQILFNEHIKPLKNVVWDERMTHPITTHEITPEMVRNKSYIDKHIPKLKAIFSVAKRVVWYNGGAYTDLLFFEKAGIRIPAKMKIDMLTEFSEIYGEWDDEIGDIKLQSLDTCADFYDYDGNRKFNDSLTEVRAIMHCYYSMIENEETEE